MHAKGAMRLAGACDKHQCLDKLVMTLVNHVLCSRRGSAPCAERPPLTRPEDEPEAERILAKCTQCGHDIGSHATVFRGLDKSFCSKICRCRSIASDLWALERDEARRKKEEHAEQPRMRRTPSKSSVISLCP